mmetsp:Transcript_19514/g.58048  ORF Transcript_19514/g.58048 Transcript_19514/m.58048 type:complete len:260 (+) Transcript_19514:898-1677(+)
MRRSEGRCTLTATRVPFLSVPRCTWPSEAAAMGSGENSEKISSTEAAPSSDATICFAFSPLKAGTSSCSDFSTSMYSGGNTSVRVESTWPSFTNVGPSVRSLSRAKVAAAVLSSLVPLRAFRTLKAQEARARQTSMLRRSELDLPRFSQPASSTSPSTSSMASTTVVGADDRPVALLSRRRSRPRVASMAASSKHSGSGSGSSTSQDSSRMPSSAFSIAGSTTSSTTFSSSASATSTVGFSSVAAPRGLARRSGRARGA